MQLSILYNDLYKFYTTCCYIRHNLNLYNDDDISIHNSSCLEDKASCSFNHVVSRKASKCDQIFLIITTGASALFQTPLF